ncbi:sodium/bile acid cotransporter 5-like [Watersipora subatra]|uniref:sodium/bile acid cotransporter 5-like n=1 Tax=Watersipora subatra TaxID=2589382 RepID=UPI00355C1F2A
MCSASTLTLLTLVCVCAQQVPTSTDPSYEMETTPYSPYYERDLLFHPPGNMKQILYSQYYVQINISTQLEDYIVIEMLNGGIDFFIGLTKPKNDLTTILPFDKIKYIPSKNYNLSYQLFWRLQVNNSMNIEPTVLDSNSLNRNGFVLTLSKLGYSSVDVHVIQRVNNVSSLISAQSYNITAIRKYRKVDLGFTIAITIVGLLNIFAIGCMSEVAVLRSQFKKSLIPVGLASATQYVITPLLTFGLMKLGRVQTEIAIGILLSACVPGGGLGHLIVLVTGNANTELSVAINFLQIFVPLGTLPLWLYTFGKFLRNGVGESAVATHYMVLCLGLLILPYLLGVAMRHLKPDGAEAILNWLIKPLLLLFMILFVTLGLYINFYAMKQPDKMTLAMAGMVPNLGFIIGGGLTLVTRQGKASAKSVAIEAAIFNCLAVIAIAKIIMPQPDADLACAGAIAVLIFTPLPFIAMLVFHKIKKKIMNYFENRKFEKEQQETITKSFALITQNALQISGMTAEQIKKRKKDETLNNFDTTLYSDEGNSEQSQTIVQMKDDHPFGETIPISQSNHRRYV